MYKNIEIEVSYKYLSKVISKLKEPICILGGWAVFFAVRKNYEKQTGRIYIGSRDIDIGFNSIEALKQASLVLENKLNFEFVSFRHFKNVHTETGKDLTSDEAKSLPRHMFFPIYVDMIISYVNNKVRSKLGFTPIDEPLLKHVFDNKKYRKGIKEFGKNLLLPTAEVLLATKLNSVLFREKEHKRQKDICDIVALCLFGRMPISDIIKISKSFLSKDKIEKFRNISFEKDIINCSNTLGLELNIARSVIDKIKER